MQLNETSIVHIVWGIVTLVCFTAFILSVSRCTVEATKSYNDCISMMPVGDKDRCKSGGV